MLQGWKKTSGILEAKNDNPCTESFKDHQNRREMVYKEKRPPGADKQTKD